MGEPTVSSPRFDLESTAAGLTVSGEIDAHTAPLLAARLDPLPDTGERVLLGMAGVEFIDSSGLRVLIDAHRRAAEAGRELVLDHPSPAVMRLISISGLERHLAVVTE
jgi:anti-sigma B factor antagonist